MRRCGRCEGWVAVPCMSTVSSQGMGTPRGSLTYSAVPLVLYTCIKDTPSGLRGAGYLRPQCDISLAHCCSQWNRALFLALPIRCACLIAYKEFTPEPEFASAWHIHLLYTVCGRTSTSIPVRT